MASDQRTSRPFLWSSWSVKIGDWEGPGISSNRRSRTEDPEADATVYIASLQQLGHLDSSVPCQAWSRVKVRRGPIPLAQPVWTPSRKVQTEGRSGCFVATAVASPTLPSVPPSWEADLRTARCVPPHPVPLRTCGSSPRRTLGRRRSLSDIRARAPAPDATSSLRPPQGRRHRRPRRGGSLEWRRGSRSRAPSSCDPVPGPSPRSRTSNHCKERAAGRSHSLQALPDPQARLRTNRLLSAEVKPAPEQQKLTFFF